MKLVKLATALKEIFDSMFELVKRFLNKSYALLEFLVIEILTEIVQVIEFT